STARIFFKILVAAADFLRNNIKGIFQISTNPGFPNGRRLVNSSRDRETTTFIRRLHVGSVDPATFMLELRRGGVKLDWKQSLRSKFATVKFSANAQETVLGRG